MDQGRLQDRGDGFQSQSVVMAGHCATVHIRTAYPYTMPPVAEACNRLVHNVVASTLFVTDAQQELLAAVIASYSSSSFS